MVCASNGRSYLNGKMRPFIFCGLLCVFLLSGCMTIMADRDRYVELKGMVVSEDGMPEAGVLVRVRTAPTFFQAMFFGPAVEALIPISRETTDAQGRFTCVVPGYTAYDVSAEDAQRTKTGAAHVKIEGKKLDHGIIITLR